MAIRSATSAAAIRLRLPVLRQPPVSRLRASLHALGGHRLLLLMIAPGLVFAGISLIMRRFGIVTWDAPAHLYKVALVQEQNAIFWDNNWYGGAYDIISYGLVFYLLAKFMNYIALVVVSAGALPVLFYLYMRRTYGDVSYWPAIGLAVVLAVYLANGQDPFVFALALMFGAMVLVAYRHPLLAVIPAAVSIFANPLAFVIGSVFLLAELIARPGSRGLYLRALLYLSPVLLARMLLGVLFSEKLTYVYSLSTLMLFVGYACVGFVLARASRDPERRAKSILFATYMAVAVLCALVPANPVGFNIGRFFFLFGMPLLAGIRRVMLPVWVTGFFVFAVAMGQIVPPASHYVAVADMPSTRAAFFAPALSFAARHYDPNYRFHVVALDTHWEAYYFSINGFPITRGWYRQADALHNDILSSDFTAAGYATWLRRMGVKYVFLPEAPLDWSGPREAAVLRSSPEFRQVWKDADWTVYRLSEPAPLAVSLDGGRDPTILALLHQALYLQVPQAGDYLIKATYSPYWDVTAGDGTLRPTAGGRFLVLHASAPGFYGIQVRVTVQASLRELVQLF